MEERGVLVDHATIQRRVVKYSAQSRYRRQRSSPNPRTIARAGSPSSVMTTMSSFVVSL
jgi:transposase-like protein